MHNTILSHISYKIKQKGIITPCHPITQEPLGLFLSNVILDVLAQSYWTI